MEMSPLSVHYFQIILMIDVLTLTKTVNTILNISDLIREVIVDNVDSMSLTQAEYLQLITPPISDKHDILM